MNVTFLLRAPITVLLLLLATTSLRGCFETWESGDMMCSDYANEESGSSCFMDYDDFERSVCEVCREDRSCFMALDDSLDQQLCQAYLEGGSCFFINDPLDQAWCDVLKDDWSCFIKLDGEEREMCERGEVPFHHAIWLY